MAAFYRIVKIQQQGENTLTATIPNDLVEELELTKGQYLRVYKEGRRVVLEKNEN